MKRTYYQDTWNNNKVWEVVRMVGAFYLRQYVKGEQYGRGIRTTKKFIESIGIFDMKQVKNAEEMNMKLERSFLQCMEELK